MNKNAKEFLKIAGAVVVGMIVYERFVQPNVGKFLP